MRFNKYINIINNDDICIDILNNDKIYNTGYNQNTRTTYRKNLCCSVHAEMDTLTRFLSSFIKIHSTKNPSKIRRKMNKFSICVVRSQESCEGYLYY